MKILICVACRTEYCPFHLYNFWYDDMPTANQIRIDVINHSMTEFIDYAIMGISRVTDIDYTKITGLKWRSN